MQNNTQNPKPEQDPNRQDKMDPKKNPEKQGGSCGC